MINQGSDASSLCPELAELQHDFLISYRLKKKKKSVLSVCRNRKKKKKILPECLIAKRIRAIIHLHIDGDLAFLLLYYLQIIFRLNSWIPQLKAFGKKVPQKHCLG